MKIVSIEAHPELGEAAIEHDGIFHFSCHPGVSCFNQCCHNLRLPLYPYDVLRLRHRLNMASESFLETHTTAQVQPNDIFPEVLLRMQESPGAPCPFLQPDGCGIYADRPDACRMFPLDRGLEFDAQGRSRLRYFFRPPTFCKGVESESTWNVKRWLADQHADVYAEMTEKWAGVRMLFHQHAAAAAMPDAERKEKEVVRMAYMAAYDLDAFRKFVFESSFLKRFQIPSSLLNRGRTDDIAMLRIGLAWIKWLLAGIESPDLRFRR
ncbi:YkgJ family cysteine cluster protein [Desulfatirhabdium butyrativorans]|uniref:YkgJ family cysteine cluster protein n=1 Tax=Desulfatirhabdium butyrativorans TaxID=340467 RepID=UPI00055383CE|nr:YkgJ family cysteine cluster protein [Desulfatirhabdium butyrativorans]